MKVWEIMENNNIAIDDEIRNYFNELLLKSGISVDEEKKEKMLGFLELMHEKNKIMNLTAIRDTKGRTEINRCRNRSWISRTCPCNILS